MPLKAGTACPQEITAASEKPAGLFIPTERSDEGSPVVKKTAGLFIPTERSDEGSSCQFLRSLTFVRDDSWVLRDDSWVLRDDSCVLRDDSWVLRDDGWVLRDDILVVGTAHCLVGLVC